MGIKLKSERLVLREISTSDIDFLYTLELLPETYYYSQDKPDDKEKYFEKYQWYIEKSKEIPATGGLCFLILKADSTEPIGKIHIRCNWDVTREWEFGYALLPAFWRKGYASEAVSTLVRYAFEHLHAHKVVAICNAENKRSAALLERLGMKLEGLLREDRWIRNRWYDYCFYTLLDREFCKTDSISEVSYE